MPTKRELAAIILKDMSEESIYFLTFPRSGVRRLAAQEWTRDDGIEQLVRSKSLPELLAWADSIQKEKS